jgi:hypothetical protein
MKDPFARIISWMAFLVPMACIILFFALFNEFYIYSIVISAIVVVMGSFGINKISPKDFKGEKVDAKNKEMFFNRLLISGGVTFGVFGLCSYFAFFIIKIIVSR